MAEKLLQIRKHLGLSQSELAKTLGFDIPYNFIIKYDLDKNEPPINVLLAYIRAVGVPLEQIVDDELELDLRAK
jgi:transcriptional regulator with XRE-family HTH domain